MSYRFYLELGENSSPRFLRFDLNPGAYADPLKELRCHVHPGHPDIRIPLSMLSPQEVLDRIFFAVEAL